MELDYDIAKSEKNQLKRGLPFDLVTHFEWNSALVAEDTRKPYTERRFQASGWINQRLYVVVFTPIPDGIRVISFRKANLREVKRYEKAQSLLD
jgi:uncharacterized DUF497 family protein